MTSGVRGLLALVVCLLGPGASFAEDVLDIHRRALEYDPTFRAARSERAATKASVNEARGALLPTATGSYEFTQEYQDIVSSDNVVFATGKTDFTIHNQAIEVSQPILHLDDWARLAQSKSELREADLLFKAAEQDLVLRVAEAYLQALAARDELDYAGAEETAVGQQRELAENRVGMGLSTRTDLYDARARHALAEAERVQSMAALEDAFEGLREVAGYVPDSLAPLGEGFELQQPEPPQVSRWIERALRENLAVRSRRAGLQAARREIYKQRAEHLPEVDFVFQHFRRETEGSVFGGGSDIATSDVIVRVSVPFFQGFRVHSRATRAKHERDAIGHQLERAELRVHREVRDSFRGILAGIGKVRALEQSVLANRSAVELKEEGLKAGLNTALAVLDAQRDLYLTLRDYSRARYDYWLNQLRLKRAVGELGVHDLMQLNEALVASEAIAPGMAEPSQYGSAQIRPGWR